MKLTAGVFHFVSGERVMAFVMVLPPQYTARQWYVVHNSEWIGALYAFHRKGK